MRLLVLFILLSKFVATLQLSGTVALLAADILLHGGDIVKTEIKEYLAKSWFIDKSNKQ